MKTFALSVLGIVCAVSAAVADDQAIAEKLTALGGQVTQDNGVVTGVRFEDLMKQGSQEDLKRQFAAYDQKQLHDVPALAKVQEVLELVSQLPNLKRLALSKCPIRDEQMPLITGLKKLEHLHLEATLISDDAYKQIAQLTELRSLALYHPALQRVEFTGKGLAALKTLPNLERVIYAGMVPARSADASTYDDGIKAIGELTQLKEYQTWHTYQSEAGNAALLNLKQLKAVNLGGWLSRPPSVTDQTLVTLAQLKGLESITLSEARISLDAFKELRNLPALKTLKINNVDIPGGTIEALREMLPGVTVTWQPASESTKNRLDQSRNRDKKAAE